MRTDDHRNQKALRLLRQLQSAWRVKFFFFRRLPSLLFWGIKVHSLNFHEAQISMTLSWRTQNPFRSIYFAAQTGAAELSTGVLAMLAIAGRGKVSMLVISMRSEFYKKATGEITFTCAQGSELHEAVTKAVETKQGQTFTAVSIGTNQQGEMVSKVWIEWSFLAKD